jgi:Protein of unknown function (DUF2934)
MDGALMCNLSVVAGGVAAHLREEPTAPGCEAGHDVQDWLQAEQELQGVVRAAGG